VERSAVKEKEKRMKRVGRRLLFAVPCAVILAGCAIAHGPVTAAVTLDMKGPVSVGPAAGSAKIGRSDAWGILVYSTGDASISAAMRNGGITRVHHVDQETTNILGLYAKYITVVYGE
jgi:hypothetical protein